MRLYSAMLDGWMQPADIFIQLFTDEPNSFWLDREHNPNEAFSVLGAGKQSNIDSFNKKATDFEDSDFSTELPFSWRPGLLGFITYEGEPCFIFAERAVVFDHLNKRMYFIGVFDSQNDFDFWHHAALLRLGLAGGQIASYLHQVSMPTGAATAHIRHSAVDYLAMIQTAQGHIEAGDIYQICLTNEIVVETKADPLLVFLRLRETNPAPYATFVTYGEITLVSSSPEQFIRVGVDGKVSSKPIKGTRPRGGDANQDALIASELQNNDKERAENLMIVDLMRNDIGKVSQAGSVSVSKLFAIESYATVHQLVSSVEGVLAAGETAWSALNAAFPGGSMTGAPKIRAMEIIAKLESGPRGVYSGCVGYLGLDGSAEFAMVIRSIVFSGQKALIGIGGGITIDSDPLAELEEIQLKAKALLHALNATDPWHAW